ncbi:uncharacterized protein [Panulirus ornatus]|uniref:uncharacterized protein n=1 Tax=Panulirus ornatus TaxID=150431 RepID=UPI003A873F6E
MAKLKSKKNARIKNDLSINKRKDKQKMHTKGSNASKRVFSKKQLKVNLKKKPSLSTNESKIKKKSGQDLGKKIVKLEVNGNATKNSNNRKKTKTEFRGAQEEKVRGKKNVKNDTKEYSSPKSKAKRKTRKGRRFKVSQINRVDSRQYERFKEVKIQREKYEESQNISEVLDAAPVNVETVHQAISGIRKLAARGKKTSKNLFDVSADDIIVFLQVTICKMPYVVRDQHLIKPKTINTHLPNSLVKEETEVILITRDLEKGIRPDHEPSLHFYQELLQKHNAAGLVNEVIPLRQLKVEYKEHEAKRILSSRADVVLCDDTVLRFVPKFLGKHFYKKKKIPVQVNLKAKDLLYELNRALSVSQLTFTMGGNCAIMKVGRLSFTDEEIAENILAAVQRLANCVPGKWKNVQNLSLKLQTSKAIPFFVQIGSLNDVGIIHPIPYFKTEPISGIVTTYPKRCVTVYPDGSVTVRSLKKNRERIPEEEREKGKQKKKLGKQQKLREKAKGKDKKKDETEEFMEPGREHTTEVETTKRMVEADGKNDVKKQKLENLSEPSEPHKKSMTKKQEMNKEGHSDSEEEELEAQELAFLKRRNEEQLADGGTSEKEEDSEADEDSDPWDEDSDYGISGSDDGELM